MIPMLVAMGIERMGRQLGGGARGDTNRITEFNKRRLEQNDVQRNLSRNHFDDFSSFHVQGAHFLVGDGSVQRINNQIDLLVYQALVTRSGGEVVNAQP